MTDPIADMITRIKNAQMAEHETVVVPHSKMREAIAQILLDHGYLSNLEVKAKKPQAELVLGLKYVHNLPAVSGVKRLSKPGRRLYAGSRGIKPTLSGYGITIVSTSKGIMTDKDARKQNVGGELICQIW